MRARVEKLDVLGWKKSPTTCCTVLDSGGSILGDSEACCDSCGGLDP